MEAGGEPAEDMRGRAGEACAEVSGEAPMSMSRPAGGGQVETATHRAEAGRHGRAGEACVEVSGEALT
jgi:hypothetical protein